MVWVTFLMRICVQVYIDFVTKWRNA